MIRACHVAFFFALASLLFIGAEAGCGDDDDGKTGSCEGTEGLKDEACQMVLPDAEPLAGSKAADYACLGKVTPPALPTKDLVIRGITKQRLSTGDDEAKGGVTVEVWVDQTKVGSGSPLASTTSDGSGSYEVTIKASDWQKASAKGPRVAWRIKAADTISTVEFNDLLYKDPAEMKTDSKDPTKLSLENLERITVTRSTLDSIVALLGITNKYDKKQGIVLGVVRDCKRLEVENASAGLVDAAGSPVSGPLLFFFIQKKPVRRKLRSCTSADGYFTLINVPPESSADLRVVGKLSGKTTVLSRQFIPVASDTLVIADFDPLPEPLK